MAEKAAGIYAEALTGVDLAELEHEAHLFVSEYIAPQHGRLFRDARSLLKGIRQRGLRPVLITGAPKEVVDHLMLALDIDEAFPLFVKAKNGVCTGAADLNHGVSTAKEAACRALEAKECRIVVAIGDSEGDRPMWDHADYAVKVGERAVSGNVDVDGLDLDGAEQLDKAFWGEFPRASWIDDLDVELGRP